MGLLVFSCLDAISLETRKAVARHLASQNCQARTLKYQVDWHHQEVHDLAVIRIGLGPALYAASMVVMLVLQRV